MHLSLEEIMENAIQQKGKRLAITGKKDPVALAAILAARDRGWIEPVACGGPLSELRKELEVYFVDSDIWQARQEALSLLRNKEAEALLDMGPLDNRFFFLRNGRSIGLLCR